MSFAKPTYRISKAGGFSTVISLLSIRKPQPSNRAPAYAGEENEVLVQLHGIPTPVWMRGSTVRRLIEERGVRL